MPIGPTRPDILLHSGVPQQNVQQLAWNGQMLLVDGSDAAFKRSLGLLLGMTLSPSQIPPWSQILELMAPLGLRGRRVILTKAVLAWSVRRRRFLSWWVRDVQLGGSAIGFITTFPEMINELILVQAQLGRWGLLMEATPDGEK